MVLPAPCRSLCPINAALEVFGDRWSLLVVRDLVFKNRTRFKDFLEAGEGVATNILTDRLERLETAGIIARRRDPEDARGVIYRLTPKGRDLAPVLVAMIVWGARYYRTAAPVAVLREMKRDRDGYLARLDAQLRRREATDARKSSGASRKGIL